MTHKEFHENWSKKHRTVFADVNRVLKAHGLRGSVRGLMLNVPASVHETFQPNDCCDDCKHPPCDDGEKVVFCSCPDGSGGFKVMKCCVKA